MFSNICLAIIPVKDMARSYYKTIQGKKYDRELLELAESLVESAKQGKLTNGSVQELIDSAMDGNVYTEIEQQTIAYILQNQPFTEAARKKLQNFHNNNQSKAPPTTKTQKAKKKISRSRNKKKQSPPSVATPIPLKSTKEPSAKSPAAIDTAALKKELYTEVLIEIKQDLQQTVDAEWQRNKPQILADNKQEIQQEVEKEWQRSKPQILADNKQEIQQEVEKEWQRKKPKLLDEFQSKTSQSDRPVAISKEQLKAELKQEIKKELTELIHRQQPPKITEKSSKWMYLFLFILFLLVALHWLEFRCHKHPTKPLQASKASQPPAPTPSDKKAAPTEKPNLSPTPVPSQKQTTPVHNTDKEIIESIQIKFHKNDYRVSGQKSRQSIRTISRILQKNPNWILEITGHTCNLGSDAFNQKISRFRAEAIKNYLVNSGVENRQIRAFGRGSQTPLFDNSTPEGREKNRRVEFRVELQ